MFLSAGLRGEQLRLVRLEDFFCVLSGAVMVALFVVEQAGVPLGAALLNSLSLPITTKLAVVFLISNLLPALLLSPALGHVLEFLRDSGPYNRDRRSIAADVPSLTGPRRPFQRV